MSQRPPQWPAVMMSHDGVTISSATPRRSAISLPTSTSKPSISLLSLRKDCGGYSGSAGIVSVLVLINRSKVSQDRSDAGRGGTGGVGQERFRGWAYLATKTKRKNKATIQ